ncbi:MULTISPECIES: class I SAM-dependent methyltransferase [Methanobacterium]|jgi:tRNA (cmo5U34)-methyltransferase|uniref:Methyltransferase type 12 n=1 Tax=Methanobacterium bryantii TaxID=2161 RepID=A0A2A2H4R0_METBR|nr:MULTISPECIES: class I SAM-dependent methyltransferase [Methanobacterium]OEC84473.1 methyltransferase type 12 [Methanobacterium sp. A39]PAV04378.1 methyltransferase type 12 [Methanobacterium bryantii]
MQKLDNLTSHLSSEYDLQIANTIPYYNFFHQEILNLVESMDINPKYWLDTGCGTGNLVEKALQKFQSTVFILADPSADMLNKAKEKLENNKNVEFLEPTPSQDISLSDPVDVITSIQSHHYLSEDERYKAVKSCYNNLNENGVYVTFENISPLTDKGTEIGKEYWRKFQISMGKTVVDADNHIKRFGVEYFPITVEDHLSLLRKSGFSVVEMFWYSYMQAGFYCIK